MDDKRRSDTFKSPSNLLLSGARGGFSLDDISASPLLVPVTENSSSVLTGDVDVDLSAGSSSVLLPAPAPVPAPVPAAAAAAAATTAQGSEPPFGAAPGGFASTFGSFTSALFGSLPAAPPASPVVLPAQPSQPAADTAEDAFQPVSLEPVEPATGPTPTFYNPGSIPGQTARHGQGHGQGHGAPPLHPHHTPPPPFVNQVGGGYGGSRPFVPQPSDLYLLQGSLVGPPVSAPLESPAVVEPLFLTPTGPPPASPFATPAHSSSVPSSGPPSRPPSGPPLPSFAAPAAFGTPTSLPTSLPSAFGTPTSPPPAFGTPTGPPPGPPPVGLTFGNPTGPGALPGTPAGPPPSGSTFGTPTGPAPPPPAGSSFATPTGPPPGPGFGPPPSTNAASGNAFRLGARRPVYAPVPGLETSAPSAPTPASAFSSAPILGSTPTNPIVMAPTVDSPSLQPQTVPEVFSNGDYYQQAAMPRENSSSLMYRPVYQHWFYKKEDDGKVFWQPFSMADSMALESQFLSPDLTSETEVPTDGSRYNVNILRRQRAAVYWEEAPSEVRRCSWYYKNHADSRYVPYDENVATRLEEEYKLCYTKNDWQGRVEFPNGEAVVFHSANAMAHYLNSTSPDAWGNTPVSPNMYSDGTQHRPRVVKRGVDEFDIESGESETVDHLLFLVHGIGSACDLKFRSVVEVVDDFRSVTQQLVESHFSASVESGKARRIEVLPVSWHAKLHSEDIERQLKSITLPSIPWFRNLTNDTLIDILFYTSPIYCQTIIDTVGKELNRLYELFLKRNPSFTGGVSLGGHSLGSLILFDLLWHQKGGPQPPTPGNSPSTPPACDVGETIPENPEDSAKSGPPTVVPIKSKLSRKISYVIMGPAGTGQPFITYPQLTFSPENFFALGSPIGVFVTVRGIDKLGEDFKFPTCPSFFNIFHPYDLVAYRVETLIRSDMESVPPVLIPHHKGRKRMHLELKETVARMGADLKQRVLDSVRSTWNSVYQLASFHRNNESLTEEMNKVLENEMMQQSLGECSNSPESESNLNIVVGKLNGGRRIDYVLQEAPLESFNGYLFSIGSHVCYWKSEDTMLLMLKEMYRSSGVNVDSQVPQQQINPPLGILSTTSTSESLNTYSQAFSSSEPALLEPSPLFPTSSHSQQIIGMDPTAPPSDSRVAGPPPVSGFYRK